MHLESGREGQIAVALKQLTAIASIIVCVPDF